MKKFVSGVGEVDLNEMEIADRQREEAEAAEAAKPTIEHYQSAIQRLVDDAAVSRQFNDGVTLASYANSTNPVWKAQSLAFVAWRDDLWQYTYVELEKVMTGQRPQPSVEDFLAELPAIVWPA